ncbi:hypothetical protein J7T55_015478 [Diaporthe amygdali]|uniref:uncharacterized protein n=1 Tax=Phomopsis amygdali TaxID=1214568 RepID=UPI0022FE99A6|nr:uncharacterized protein J7T55_015478 [Diaporthe amygdali]KAJ0120746.1 hypothetical protein J7T55_015478 [Diaporthe amygdali]
MTDAPQEIQVPGDASLLTVHDSSFISNSTSLSSVSVCATGTPDQQHNEAGNSVENGRTDSSGTGFSNVTGPDDSGTLNDKFVRPDSATCVVLLDDKAAESGKLVSDELKPVANLVASPAPGKYSRKDLHTQDAFWTCSLEEFRAMSDKQWASFGTTFYIAPDGFDTATKHVVELD